MSKPSVGFMQKKRILPTIKNKKGVVSKVHFNRKGHKEGAKVTKLRH
jgi:hypothetical protein